jgi:hypothetical protein
VRLALFETRMERWFSRGAEQHLTSRDDYRQRQQEQPEEPQRKPREHRFVIDDDR